MEVFKFPFFAEIWGTVSDWVMILVTTVTAYFLYKTLQSQKDVQEAQNELLKIEQIRLREQFKPVLAYSRFEDGFAQNAIPKEYLVNKEIVSIAICSINENKAIQVRPLYNDVQGAEVWVNKLNLINLSNNKDFISVNFLVSRTAGEPLVYGFSFTVNFEDLIGTKYKQHIFCARLQNNDEALDFSIPQIII